MNDTMPLLDMSCTLFLKVAVGVLLLCLARVCLAYAKRQAAGAPLTTTTVTASTTIAPPALLTSEPMATAPEVSAPPAPAEEIIECGNCGKEIRSGPVQQTVFPPAEIYLCENCGTRVQVPL